MRSKQVFATGPDAGTPLHNPQPEQRRPGILTRKRNSNIKSNPISSRLSSTSKAAASRPRRVAPSTSSNDVTIQGDNVVYVTAHTDQEDTLRSGESGTAVLIPVMLVGSDEQRFEEAQKTVVVHVAQMDAEESEQALMEVQSMENDSTHSTGTEVEMGTQHCEEPHEEAEPDDCPPNQVYINVKETSKATEDSVTSSPKGSAGPPVARWYEDNLFVDELQCLICGQSMEAVKLAEHLPSAHGYRPPEVGRAAFLKYIRTKKIPIAIMPGRARMSGREGVGACPNCKRTFLKRLDLLAHMHEEHGQGFVLFDYEFESSSQFEKWLEYITVEFMTGYSKYRTNVNAAGIKSQMYLCRMESKPVCKSTTYKTDRRARNRAKTTYCTAHLQVRFLGEGRLHVKGSPTHINHPVDLFNAYRSLDDVPFDALPGYVAINSKASNGMYTKTVEFCQRVLRRTQSLNELLHTSPAPSEFNSMQHLHGKLQSLNELLAGYKFRTLTIQEEAPSETILVR